MQQMSFLDSHIENHIPGLLYIPNYITKEEEFELLDTIDRQPWISELKRRVQHYGYKYNDKNRSISLNSYLGKLPNWLVHLCNKLKYDKIFLQNPTQAIINEYMPGQGIAPHVDCKECFGEVICSLSLASDCVMDFFGSYKVSKLLPTRSLLVLFGDARYKWKHAIAARKYDNMYGTKIQRTRRVSITFREIIK